MTRKLTLLAVLVLGLGVLTGGIAIAAGGGAGPQAETPAGAETGEDDDGAENGSGSKAESDAGAKGEDGDGSQDEAGNGEASESSDSEETLTDPAAKKAADAAVAATGGGTVASVERDDGNAGYEVELRKSDGSEAEVQLDPDFKVREQSAEDD